MIHYRETILKSIIQLQETDAVESLIDSALTKLAENGVHPFILVRFIDKLKIVLGELKNDGDINEDEKNNVIQALNVLENYDTKKITGSQISLTRKKQ